MSYAALHSHSIHPDASVHDVIVNGIRRQLAPRLTAAAAAELTVLEDLLSDVILTDEDDIRSSPLELPGHQLKAGPIYKLATAPDSPCDFFDFIWHNRAPPRVQFFAWLLIHGRIQCKSNLLHKHIVAEDVCDLCRTSPETTDHVIFDCPFATSFWRHVGFGAHHQRPAECLWETQCPPGVPTEHFATFMLLSCWQVWKHRNEVVFRNQEPSLPRLLQSCREEAQLWRCHLPQPHRPVATTWCNIFSM